MQYNGSNGSHSPKVTKHLNNTEEESDIDLLKIFNLLLLNKWIIVAFIILGGIAAHLFLQSQIPLYESRGTIMISQNQNRYSYAGSDLSSLLTTTYGIGVGSSISNELLILRSIKQSYELADRLLEIELDENGKKFPILWVEYPVDSTTATREKIASRYRSSISFDRIDPSAEVVQISFRSPSPNEATEIVNQTMDAYSTLSTEQNRTMAVSALSFLRDERNRIEVELRNSEDSLRSFMNETNLISITPQSNQLISKLADIETQRQTIEVNLVAINATIDEYESLLESITPGLAERYSEAVEPIIERSQFRIAELETEKLMLTVKNPDLSDTNPELQRINREINLIKEQIRNLTSQLLEGNADIATNYASNVGGNLPQRLNEITKIIANAKVEKIQAETQMEVLEEYFQTLEIQFENLPDEIIALSRLERDVKINEQLYLLVANQYAEMSLWEKTQFGMGRPLDYALPTSKPVSPRSNLIYLIGIFLSSFLALAFILIKELLNDKVTSTDDLKDFNLPLIGTIPDFSILEDIDPKERQFIDNKSISNQLITFLDHISPMSEAYRRLRINVVYAKS